MRIEEDNNRLIFLCNEVNDVFQKNKVTQTEGLTVLLGCLFDLFRQRKTAIDDIQDILNGSVRDYKNILE